MIHLVSNQIHVGRQSKIDFKIVIGDIATSIYDKFPCHWLKSQFVPRDPVAKVSAPLWEKMVKETQQLGIHLTNGRLARLVSQKELPKNAISLTLQPTNYKTFCTTNLLLDHPIVPHPKKTGLITIRELAEGDIDQAVPFLANPLNVIAMLITSDKYTFIAKRSESVYESPCTWQASVGGSLKLQENPIRALIRETEEEWKIKIKEQNIKFFLLGVNGHTGEPDLIGMIETAERYEENKDAFHKLSNKPEFDKISVLHLDLKNIQGLTSIVFSKEWSQPSDQAAYLITLIRIFGIQHISDAIHTLGL